MIPELPFPDAVIFENHAMHLRFDPIAGIALEDAIFDHGLAGDQTVTVRPDHAVGDDRVLRAGTEAGIRDN